MRAYLSMLLAGLVLASVVSVGQAQEFIYRGYSVVPSPYPGNFGYSSSYASPYGYRSYNATGIYPTPFGYNAYQVYDNRIRPYYTGPYHSITFDPITNTYRYGSGYANTPNYYYQHYSGY